MNKIELVICAPMLPLFAIYSAICKRKDPFLELKRLAKNWHLHWIAS